MTEDDPPIELDAPLEPPPSQILASHGITVDQTLSAGTDSYAVFSASDELELARFLSDAGIEAEKISEVLFVNSPLVGGGVAAGAKPRDGHQVFVIERPIPGVGSFIGTSCLTVGKTPIVRQKCPPPNATRSDQCRPSPPAPLPRSGLVHGPFVPVRAWRAKVWKVPLT